VAGVYASLANLVVDTFIHSEIIPIIGSYFAFAYFIFPFAYFIFAFAKNKNSFAYGLKRDEAYKKRIGCTG
jgi:hypothetical protein